MFACIPRVRITDKQHLGTINTNKERNIQTDRQTYRLTYDIPHKNLNGKNDHYMWYFNNVPLLHTFRINFTKYEEVRK
jgi:hypothetical protein